MVNLLLVSFSIYCKYSFLPWYSIYLQETFNINKSRKTEEIDYPECKDTKKVECVYLKKNYNSVDLTEVEQIDEYVEWKNKTLRPMAGPILKQVCARIE